MRVRAASCLGVSLLISATAAATAGVGVWTTNGPPGGASNAVVADPGSRAVVYAGGLTALFKSVNGGLLWQALNLSAVPLAADPAGSVYAAGINFPDAGVFVGTLYASEDGGADWNALEQGSETSYRLTIDPFASTTLYRIDTMTTPNHPPPLFGALFRSTDSAATWTETDQGLGLSDGYISAFTPDPRTAGTFYAATAGSEYFQPVPAAIFRTADGGSSWVLRGTILGTVATLCVDPFTPSTLYAGVVTSFNSGGSTGTFKSTDGGMTFHSVNGFTPTQLVVDPNTPNRIYLATSGQGVQSSADGGSTWAPLNTGLTDLTVFSLALNASGTALHAATASGVFDYQIAVSNCTPDTHTLCLNNGRFAVTADFQSTPEGPSTPATAVPLTGDTGYFWFFDPSNIELVTKVLNGCTVDGDFWFFASGLTNVGVQINVTDTVTGTSKNYTTTFGTAFQPIQDTAAFPCP